MKTRQARTRKRVQVTHVETLPVGVLLYTKTQMATLLQVSVRCVERMMRGGELSYLKLNGRLVRFRLEDVNHLVEKCEVRSAKCEDNSTPHPSPLPVRGGEGTQSQRRAA
ncbi:MAG TPA: helix-turn-helix domain-containing protein [Verrucomicrobiae bacterium]